MRDYILAFAASVVFVTVLCGLALCLYVWACVVALLGLPWWQGMLLAIAPLWVGLVCLVAIRLAHDLGRKP